MALFDRFFHEVGIDLGTANSLVYLKGAGLVVDEATVVAVNAKTSQILAIGDDARRMLGRTPSHISVIRPLTNGVISDFEMTQEVLRQLLKKAGAHPLTSFRRAVLAIPDNLTEVERKSVEDAAANAGCAKVQLVESPVAAALGAGLPVTSPQASLVIDIGGGTTDIAVISMGGVVVSKTLKVAGDKLNDDIREFVRNEFRLTIGEPTAELAKVEVGSAVPLDDWLEVPVRGRDLSTGLPKEITLKNTHVRAALMKSLGQILDGVFRVVEETPPELVGDMLKEGMHLCGGGALLRGIDQLLGEEVAVAAHVVEDPLTCVTRGLGMIVDGAEKHKALLDNPLKPLTINL